MKAGGRKGNLALQIASLALFVAAWQALVHFKAYRFGYIPSVPQVLTAAQTYLFSAQFVSETGRSSSSKACRI